MELDADRPPLPMAHPTAVLGWVRRRLAQREDREHEQTLICLSVSLLAVAFFNSPLFLDRAGPGISRWLPTGSIAFALILLGLFAWIVGRPRPCPVRRVIGIAVDVSAISVAVVALDELSVVTLALYLWVILGNGFRFGIAYLVFALAAAILGFGLAALQTPFWLEHPAFSVAMLIMLVVVPAYAASLLGRHHRAACQARIANRAKSQFLTGINRDLRTPLSSLLGMADLLLNERDLTARQRELTFTIHSSLQHLHQLVDEVADVSRTETGQLVCAPVDFDLHELLGAVVALLRPQARAKGIRLTSHVAPRLPWALRGEARFLRQVLINLIGNAVKFTDAGAVDIHVRLLHLERDRARVRFRIVDTGTGIAPEHQKRIFDPFEQADVSITRTHGGTGLGVTIARHLVGLMGGSLRLASRPGLGTCFYFDVVLARQAGGSARPSRAVRASRPLTLLPEPLAASIGDRLAAWGMEAQHAPEPAAAIYTLLSEFDSETSRRVVLLKPQSFGIDPCRFAGILHQEPALESLPLILVASEKEAAAYQEAWLRSGYSAVITEPVDEGQLHNALRAACTPLPTPAAPEVSISASGPASSPPDQAMLILLAEDNRINQTVIRRLLEHLGHRVCIVDNGAQALERLSADPRAFDLLILDLHMPHFSGADVLKARSGMPGDPCPAIILTADATPEALALCRAAGAEQVLTKPVTLDALGEALARIGATHGPFGNRHRG
jgi:two-component system, sensor histidine kinase RpfC